MGKYIPLEKFYFKNKDEKLTFEEYHKRFQSPYALKTNLKIVPILKGERKTDMEYPLFCGFTNNMNLLQEKIYLNSKIINDLSAKLPGIAKNACKTNILINEIINSNAIENIVTTSKDIKDEMSHKTKGKKLIGIINKYEEISNGTIDKIKKPEEIKEIYFNVFKDDVLADPQNKLDGAFFRNDAVYITENGITIHAGIPSEKAIIESLKSLIKFMNNGEVSSIVKACITHYFLEYIHPFYDGNGRFGRLIFSAYLAKKLDIYTGLSLSSSIQKNNKDYYKIFKDTSKPRNCGDLTPFILEMMKIIVDGQKSTISLLEDSLEKIDFGSDYLKKNYSLSELEFKVAYIYIQDYIFDSSSSLTDQYMLDVMKNTNNKMSRKTLNKTLERLVNLGIILKIKKNPSVHVLSEKIQEEFA